MANIISMKGTSKSMNTTNSEYPGKEPEYPWGLRLTLNDEAIEKLGLNFSRFNSGVPGKMMCEFITTGKSENEYDGKINREITIQITGMSKPSTISRDRMKTGMDLLNRMRKGK